MPPKYYKYAALVSVALSSITLVALQQKPLGWTLLALAVVFSLLAAPAFRRDMLLICLALAIVGLTPVGTDLSLGHITIMTVMLVGAVALPYLISRFVFKDYTIRFPFKIGRGWLRSEIIYIFVPVLFGYLVFPIYFATTGAHHNWEVVATPSGLSWLFYGTNSVGAWDEFMFICVFLTVLSRHFTFRLANSVQAIIFTSFLYELGFTGWAFLPLLGFAYIQGHIFHKTHSLIYVLTIHLSVDLILYFALIHATYPQSLPIFITG